MARESEAARKQQLQTREGDKKELEVIRRNPSRDSSQNRSKRGSIRNKPTHGLTNSSKPAQKAQQRETVCTRCGKDHPTGRESSPARLSKCFKCCRTWHFNRLCRSTVNIIKTRTGNDSEKSEEINSDSDWKFLGVVTGTNTTKQRMTKLYFNRRIIKFKTDTGADVTVILSTTDDLYYDGPLHCTKTPLVGPEQNELKVCGCFETTLQKEKPK